MVTNRTAGRAVSVTTKETMFILLSIINLTAALAVLAVPTYRLWDAPWQAYQQRRRATLAYKQSLAMAEIEKMEGLALA
jgi:hypothetical protein